MFIYLVLKSFHSTVVGLFQWLGCFYMGFIPLLQFSTSHLLQAGVVGVVALIRGKWFHVCIDCQIVYPPVCLLRLVFCLGLPLRRDRKHPLQFGRRCRIRKRAAASAIRYHDGCECGLWYFTFYIHSLQHHSSAIPPSLKPPIKRVFVVGISGWPVGDEASDSALINQKGELTIWRQLMLRASPHARDFDALARAGSQRTRQSH